MNKIRAAPENQSLWSDARDDDLLSPEDVVEIPDPEQQSRGAPSNQKVRFRRRLGGTTKLILRLEDEDGPRNDVEYGIYGPELLFSGKTGPNGKIEHEIDSALNSVDLRLPETGEEYEVLLAHLNPSTQISGAAQRLSNLGFYNGPDTEALTPALRKALQRFQRDNNLPEDGNLTAAVSARLTEKHGC